MSTPHVDKTYKRVNVWKIPPDQAHDVMIRCLATWRQAFPGAFPCPKYNRLRPLKKGIHADIIARDPSLSEDDCRIALHRYTKWTVYLQTLRPDAERFDLDGKPCGTVTAEEALGAKNLIKARGKRYREAKKHKTKAAEKPKPLGLADLKAAYQQRKSERVSNTA